MSSVKLNRRELLLSPVALSLSWLANVEAAGRKRRPEPKIIAYGVYHGIPGDEVLKKINTSQITKIFTKLKQRGVKRVGIEFPPAQHIAIEDWEGQAYVRLLEGEAKKFGVTLVRLEDTNAKVLLPLLERSFRKFQEEAQEKKIPSSKIKDFWARKLRALTIASEDSTDQIVVMYKNAIASFTNAINEGHSFIDIERSIGHFRSKLMLEEVKKRGLHHIIAGSVHAHELDLPLNQIEKHNFLTNIKETTKELKLRRQAYEKAKKHIQAVWEIITRHPQSKKKYVPPYKKKVDPLFYELLVPHRTSDLGKRGYDFYVEPDELRGKSRD